METEAAVEEEFKGVTAKGWEILARTLETLPRPERKLSTVSLTQDDIDEMSMGELKRHAVNLGLKNTEHMLRPELSELVKMALGSPPPPGTCTKCGAVGPVPEMFGYRVVTYKGTKKRIRQSWCRGCRKKVWVKKEDAPQQEVQLPLFEDGQ